MNLGYALSSEEHSPLDRVGHALLAEDAGFSYAVKSDHFEEAAAMVREDAIAEKVVCGPDPEKHLAALQKFLKAGFDHVYVHQVGPDQEGFIDFYGREIVPATEALEGIPAGARAA